MADTDSKQKRRRPGCLRLLVSSILLLVLGIIWVLFKVGDFRAFEVSGGSMLPTLDPGDRVIAEKADPATLKRGDIVVVANLPFDKSDELIKRLIGLPGDTVHLRDGVFYVNGRAEVPPPGSPPFFSTEFLPSIKLGPDHYFVLGDNRPISYDSTEFGPVSSDEIWGHVLLRYVPWKKRGWL